MKSLLLALVSTVLLAVPALAQVGPPSTLTQQSATRLDAGVRCDSATGVGAQATLTLVNPGPGLSDYLTSLVVTMEATGVIAAASPIPVTSTGINGTSPTFGSIPLGVTTLGQVESPIINMTFTSPIKANSNVAPTFVVASVTNGTSRLTACYFQAP